jgi:hypothetical protein
MKSYERFFEDPLKSFDRLPLCVFTFYLYYVFFNENRTGIFRKNR